MKPSILIDDAIEIHHEGRSTENRHLPWTGNLISESFSRLLIITSLKFTPNLGDFKNRSIWLQFLYMNSVDLYVLFEVRTRYSNGGWKLLFANGLIIQKSFLLRLI